MAEKVISQVKFEIEQIGLLFEAYADLLDRVQKRTPDLVEVTAVASVLHSFYNCFWTAWTGETIFGKYKTSPQKVIIVWM